MSYNNSDPNQMIHNVYEKNNYYGGSYPMQRTKQDLKSINSFKPLVENYCSNNRAQAALALQDNDNPSSYRSFIC
jgi:hypothetical protein